jgi:hypothetical protein
MGERVIAPILNHHETPRMSRLVINPYRFASDLVPTSIGGLALWLDASDASTLYDATSGGSLVAADGAVARWEDKSGNSRHATQTTSGLRPLRRISQQNGRDALAFVDDWLNTPAFAGSQASTTFAVLALTEASGTDIAVGWASSYQSPSPGGQSIYFNAGKFAALHNGGSSGVYLTGRESNAAVGLNTFVCVAQRTDGTHAGHKLFLNGNEPASTATFTSNPGTFTKAATSCGIGAYNNGVTPITAKIAEVLLYTATLSDTDRAAVVAYLMAKWGIS